MCEFCRSSPCDSRCPNAGPPTPLYKCNVCEDGIYAEELMTFINDEAYHVECLEIRDVLEMLGCEVEEAGDIGTARRS